MKRHLAIATLLLCAAVVVATLVALLKLRFEAGDVYPPYSTLRADPLGAMALLRKPATPAWHLGTTRLPGNKPPARRLGHNLPTACRGDIPLAKIARRRRPRDRTVYDRGRAPCDIRSPPKREKISASGRRPEAARRNRTGKKPMRRKNAPMANPKTTGFPFPNGGISSLALRHWNRTKTDSVEVSVIRNVSGLALPSELKWHSGAFLKNLGSSWRAIYSRDARSVVVERKFGQGGMVFATDSYFTSNEAMLDDRHAQLLAWLVGPNRHVVFDEAPLRHRGRAGDRRTRAQISAARRDCRIAHPGGLVYLEECREPRPVT